ncbi:tectonic-3-like isoform X2 [Scyliorhinus canicula]|uniref:tectonic-3-like isoform X2 n=1 Tax=Scyliorhinus canicula TaxID=7830 RepID=UPI0018F6AEB4|nr:tectonic-3-like isoform X2 [Scyliorhinus canicula]
MFRFVGMFVCRFLILSLLHSASPAAAQRGPEPGSPGPGTFYPETPDPGSLHHETPDPGTLHLGTPDPETLHLGTPETPDPITLHLGTPDPETLHLGTPETPDPITLHLGTPETHGPGSHHPGTADPGFADPSPLHPGTPGPDPSSPHPGTPDIGSLSTGSPEGFDPRTPDPGSPDHVTVKSLTTAVPICTCDLAEGVCELNCCCDPDCSSIDIGAFSSCLRGSQPVVSQVCVEESVIFTSNTPFQTVINKGHLDTLFCVIVNDAKANYFVTPQSLRREKLPLLVSQFGRGSFIVSSEPENSTKILASSKDVYQKYFVLIFNLFVDVRGAAGTCPHFFRSFPLFWKKGGNQSAFLQEDVAITEKHFRMLCCLLQSLTDLNCLFQRQLQFPQQPFPQLIFIHTKHNLVPNHGRFHRRKFTGFSF